MVPVHDGPASPLWDRVCALIVLGVAGFLTWLLLGVSPDPRGFGTHEQLGMAACGWPAGMGLPCPTCGATTAACHLVHLQPLAALAAHPFGALLAAGGLWLGAWAALCLLRGGSFLDPVVRLPWGRLALWTLVLFLGSWAVKSLTFAP